MSKGSSRWRRLTRNKSELLFWILGLLVILSMIASMIVVALPQPEPPTPTPAAWLPGQVRAAWFILAVGA